MLCNLNLVESLVLSNEVQNITIQVGDELLLSFEIRGLTVLKATACKTVHIVRNAELMLNQPIRINLSESLQALTENSKVICKMIIIGRGTDTFRANLELVKPSSSCIKTVKPKPPQFFNEHTASYSAFEREIARLTQRRRK
ncbi:MAG: hypothetical protein CL579_00165 [Alteromonadaceae bacterium]|nr:hypothetical protein [Alteromonadaceae bacterium]MBB17890.1 hypothetical protein [Rickettsiales bacterium]